MCKHAKDVALTSIKLAITLLVCQAALLLGPFTYYNLQVVRSMPELVGAVLLLGGIGTAWLQSVHNRTRI